MSGITLRDFRDTDAAQVNRVALAAFDEFKSEYTDWPAMVSAVAKMSALADAGEIVVAELEERIVGAVAYIPAGVSESALLRSVMADHSDARRRSRLQRLRSRPGVDRSMHGASEARRIACDRSSHKPHHDSCPADVHPDGVPAAA
jgi:hypothetical protein